MQTSIKSLIVTLMVFFIIGCSKGGNPVDPSSTEMVYPLAVGNEWSYNRIFSTFNFRSVHDSIPKPADFTVSMKTDIVISRVETIQGAIPTFVLMDITYDGMRTYTGEFYYNNREDGLYKFANKGTSLAVPKVTQNKKILFKGRYFNSINEITAFIEFGSNFYSSSLDSLYYEVPPLKSLPRKYRLGDQWTFRTKNNPLRIDKKIIGKESIEIIGRNFECYKIQWLIDFDNNGEWEKDIEFFDWVSPEGLIRRTILYKDIAWIGSGSPDPIGKFDAKEEISLTNLSVKSNISSLTGK